MKSAQVSVEQHETTTIIAVRGEVDLSNSDGLRNDILGCVNDNGAGMILDLTETTYLDSSGIRLLFELAEVLHSRRKRLVIVVSEEALIRRVVVLTKLDDAVPLVATLDDAIAALDPA